MEEMYEVYHGTKRSTAVEICKTRFVPSVTVYGENELFLGDGVYFFTEYEDAIDWNIIKFKREKRHIPIYNDIVRNYSIIRSRLEVKDDKVLNLNNRIQLKKMDTLVEKSRDKLKTTPEYETANNKEAALINLLYKRGEVTKQLIIKDFPEEIFIKNLKSFKNFNRKVLCVKDIDIIKESAITDLFKKAKFDGIIYFHKK